MTPDTPTLFLTAAIICGLIAGLQLMLSVRLRTAPLRFWAASNLAFCLGCAIFAARASLPLPVSALAGNGLLILGIGLIAGGIAVFDGRHPRFGRLAAGTAIVVIALAASVTGGDRPAERIIIASLGVAGYTMLAAVRLLRLKHRRLEGVRIFCATIMLLFALLYLARGIGVYAGVLDTGGAVSGVNGGVLRVLALVMAVTWSFCSLFLTLDRAASTDDLTGLLNRRTTLSIGQELVKDALAHDRPMSVLMLDLDHFKSVNDRFGHHVGDQVLAAFAGVATRSVRAHDVVGRVGGEEFCIILPDCREAEAREIAERVRAQCETDLRRVSRQTVNLTVTIGIAVLTPADGTILAMVKAADAALYEGKALGRNRIAGAGGDTASPARASGA